MDRDKHLQRMREIASGSDSSNPLADDDRDIASAITYLLERRVEDLARKCDLEEEIDKLKRKVEELERKQVLKACEGEGSVPTDSDVTELLLAEQ